MTAPRLDAADRAILTDLGFDPDQVELVDEDDDECRDCGQAGPCGSGCPYDTGWDRDA